MPVIPAFGRLRKKDCCEFEANMGYIVVPGQPALQNVKKKTHKIKSSNRKSMSLKFNKLTKANTECFSGSIFLLPKMSKRL